MSCVFFSLSCSSVLCSVCALVSYDVNFMNLTILFRITEGKGKNNSRIFLRGIVLLDECLHPLSASACQCVCFLAILLECWSPTVPPQRPISLHCLGMLNEIFALRGAGWRREVRAITCLSFTASVSGFCLSLSVCVCLSFSVYFFVSAL